MSRVTGTCRVFLGHLLRHLIDRMTLQQLAVSFMHLARHKSVAMIVEPWLQTTDSHRYSQRWRMVSHHQQSNKLWITINHLLSPINHWRTMTTYHQLFMRIHPLHSSWLQFSRTIHPRGMGMVSLGLCWGGSPGALGVSRLGSFEAWVARVGECWVWIHRQWVVNGVWMVSESLTRG